MGLPVGATLIGVYALSGFCAALGGLLYVIAKGDLDTLLAVRFNRGDAWIAVASACWTAYSVLLGHWKSALPPLPRLAALVAPAQVPADGEITIFNRSHYEDVLITRVHKWCDDATAKKRMKAINDFEQLLKEHNNTHILKFYLHISPEEQQERLKERIADPTKQWKYNEKDFEEAKLWDTYMEYYEACFDTCNKIPWMIVPADQNWYKEYLIARAVRDTLKGLKMQFPGLKK